MFFFGARASRIGSFKVTDSHCDYCKEARTHRVTVYGRYVHIFWLPVFPFGKKVVAECLHCNRTIPKKEFPGVLQTAYQEKKHKAKNPLWQWIGLCMFALLFGFVSILSSSEEEDPRLGLLQADERLMTSSPTAESDSISYILKHVFDKFATDEINPNDFEYLTKIKEDKALILIRIPKLRHVKKEGRAEVLEVAKEVVDNIPDLNGKDIYIGVKGLISMILIKTPDYEVNSRFNLPERLLEFYGPKPDIGD